MNWKSIFGVEYEREEPANESQLNTFIDSWNKELSTQEIDEIRKYATSLNVGVLKFPIKHLPNSYLDFLRFSNGGYFQNGDRYFQFFNTNDFREMNLAYAFPLWMPNAVSFAMDGAGNHYIFDMREKAVNGEFPILVSHSSVLDFEDAIVIGSSFLEVCKGKTAVDGF